MISTHYHIADLDQSALADVQALEKDLGVTLVAIESAPAPARLTQEQLERVQALEKETGKVLLAYD